MKNILAIILIIIMKITLIQQFSPLVNSKSFICLTENYPMKETIKLSFSIDIIDKVKSIKDIDFKENPDIFVLNTFLNDKPDKILNYNSQDLTKNFIHYNFDLNENLKICFNNNSNYNIIVNYTIKNNFDLKDYTLLPTKDLIPNFAFYIEESKNLLKFIKSNLKLSQDISNKDSKIVLENENIYYSILIFSIFLISIIFITKLFQIYYLEKTMKEKKYL